VTVLAVFSNRVSIAFLTATVSFILMVGFDDRCAAQTYPDQKTYEISGEPSGFEREFFRDEETLTVDHFLNSGRRGEVYVWTCLSGGLTAWPSKCEVWKVGDRAELRIDQGRRGYDWRQLEPAELANLEGFVSSGIDHWPARIASISDAPFFQFAHLTPNSGHRFWANVSNWLTPDRGRPLDQYEEFYVFFQELVNRKPTRSVYTIFGSLPGARTLWEGDGAFLILQDEQGFLTCFRQPGGGEHWKRLDDSGLMQETSPPGLPSLKQITSRDWTFSFNKKKLIAKDNELRLEHDGKTEHVANGLFEEPVLGSGTNAILLLQADTKKLILLDLASLALRELGQVDEQTRPIAYVPEQSAFLVARMEYTFPNYGLSSAYMLDPISGETREVEGLLEPLLSARYRTLQIAAPGKYWVAIPGEDGTAVGRLDAKTFAFEAVMEYPTLSFDSSQIWVSDGKVYVADGDILLLPLQRTGR